MGSVGAYRINVSGEGTLYQERVDYREEPGVKEDVAERASLRNADAQLLHQSRRAQFAGVRKKELERAKTLLSEMIAKKREKTGTKR